MLRTIVITYFTIIAIGCGPEARSSLYVEDPTLFTGRLIDLVLEEYPEFKLWWDKTGKELTGYEERYSAFPRAYRYEYKLQEAYISHMIYVAPEGSVREVVTYFRYELENLRVGRHLWRTMVADLLAKGILLDHYVLYDGLDEMHEVMLPSGEVQNIQWSSPRGFSRSTCSRFENCSLELSSTD